MLSDVSTDVADHLAFGQQPSATTAGQSISPAGTVRVEDQHAFPTRRSSDLVSVDVTGAAATLHGTATHTTSNGVATFGGLSINTAGTYTLHAADTTRAHV